MISARNKGSTEPKGMMFQNILIFGHSNIGDAIYDLAVVRPLRQRYPGAKISFLTSPRCQNIIDNYDGVNKVIVLDRHGPDKSFLNGIRFTTALKKEKFDLVIVLTSSLNYIFLRSPAVWRVRKSNQLRDSHPVDRYVDMLRSYGLGVEKASFSFGIRDTEVSFCHEFLTQKGIRTTDILVGVLPLAAWPLKSWPIGKWSELAEILKQRWGIKMLNLGKLPDNECGRWVAGEISRSIIPAHNTTLAQAKALLNCCQMFIGPDSSLLHLASCMGVETIGLYGATACDRFYPYFHRNSIIVPKNKRSCMPCYPGDGPSCHANTVNNYFGPCMNGIEVADVLGVIRERLHLP